MSETNEDAGERTNGDTRSRHTYRICLPSTADEDDVAIPQRLAWRFSATGIYDKGISTGLKPLGMTLSARNDTSKTK